MRGMLVYDTSLSKVCVPLKKWLYRPSLMYISEDRFTQWSKSQVHLRLVCAILGIENLESLD